MNKFFKRLIAYIIDITVISLVVTLLTSNNKINFQYNNYQKNYKEYNEISAKYNKVIDKQNKLHNKYKKKNITKNKYIAKNKKYKKNIKAYENKIKVLQRNIMRNSVIYYSLYIAFILAYFGIFQYSFNGQTLGKRLMKLQVTSKNLGLLRMLLRSLILYNLWIYIVGVLMSYYLDVSTYYKIYSIINSLGSIIQIIIVMMIIMNKDNRGLHDYVAGTKVEIINKEQEEVIEAEIEEV